jgi:hypothetical protein
LGGFESQCTKQVLRIVGSTDRHLIQLFHPGIDAWFQLPQLMLADRPMCHHDPRRLGHLDV